MNRNAAQMPKEKEKTINNIIGDLKQIDNIVAIVLGVLCNWKSNGYI